MNSSTWRKLSAPIRRRITLMVSRAVGRLVDPATLLQTLQLELLKGEVLDGVEHMEGYGRTAHPPAGYEALTASLGGDRAHTVALAAFHRQFRVRNLAEGEQAIYDDLGNVIHFKRDRIMVNSGDLVEVIAPEVKVIASTKITLDSPLVACTNDLQVTGLATVGALSSTGVAGSSSVSGDLNVTGGDVTVDGISSKHHKHQEYDIGGLCGEAQ